MSLLAAILLFGGKRATKQGFPDGIRTFRWSRQMARIFLYSMFTDEFLDTVLKCRAPLGSALAFFARERATRRGLLAQFRHMYSEMPENAKSDRNLTQSLSNLDTEEFLSHLDIVSAHWVLKQLTQFDVVYEPLFNGKKPDLGVRAGNLHFVEVARISDDEGLDMEKIKEELEKTESDFYVFVKVAKSDSQGAFYGLKSEMENFLKSSDLQEYENYEITTTRGARIEFTLDRAGQRMKGCFGGYMGRGGWGDCGEEPLRRTIIAKCRKYKFPFLLMVMTRPFHPGPRTLHQLLFGQNGFWVKGGVSQKKFSRLAGVVHVRQRYNDSDDKVQFKPYVIWNPSLRSDWEKLLPNLPVWENEIKSGEIILVPPQST